MTDDMIGRIGRKLLTGVLALMLVSTALGPALTVVGVDSSAGSSPIGTASASHECDGVDMIVYLTSGLNQNCQENHAAQAIEDLKDSDANQTHVDMHQALASANQNADEKRTILQNKLLDLETDALDDGRAAYVKEYKDSGSTSAARSAGIQAIEQNYVELQRRILEMHETHVTDVRYALNRTVQEDELLPSDVFTGHLHHNFGTNESNKDIVSVLDDPNNVSTRYNVGLYGEVLDYRRVADDSNYGEVEMKSGGFSQASEINRTFNTVGFILADGSTKKVPVITARGFDNESVMFVPAPGELIAQGPYNDLSDYGNIANTWVPNDQQTGIFRGPVIQATADGAADWRLAGSAEVLYAARPNDNYNDAVAYDPDEYGRLFVQTHISKNKVIDNFEAWENSTGPAIENGSIDPNDAISSMTWAEQFADNYQDSNYYLYYSALMADAGYATPELKETGAMRVEYDGEEHWGHLIFSEQPSQSLEPNVTYSSSQFDGSVQMVTTEDRFEITGEFTILEARDRDGNRIESIDYRDYNDKAINNTEYVDRVEDLKNTSQQIENTEPSVGTYDSDGGLFSGLSLPSLGGIPLWLIALLLAGLAAAGVLLDT